MDRKRLFAISTGIIFLAASMSSCGGSPEDIDELSPKEPVGGIPVALPPQCKGDFAAPVLVSPAEGHMIDEASPYAYAWTIDCRPKSYNLKVFYYPRSTGPTIAEENFETTALEWDSNEPLRPMTTYEWRLIAVGWDSDTNWKGSEWAAFTTGPRCDADELIAPRLIYPVNGSVYTGKSWGNAFEVEADIAYPSTTCIPDGYQIYISETSDFSSPDLNHFPPVPFYTTNPDGILLVEDDSNDVPDCTLLFWRAWPTREELKGPYSETHHFFTNIEGACYIGPSSAYVIPELDTNCRASDFKDSQNLATLQQGDFAKVIAVNPSLTHVRVIEPNSETKCWVWLDLVDLRQGYDPLDTDHVSAEVDPNEIELHECTQGQEQNGNGRCYEPLAADKLPDLVDLVQPPAPSSTPTFTPEPEQTKAPEPNQTPQCSDGIDNDQDQFVDGNDPQCSGQQDDSEAN